MKILHLSPYVPDVRASHAGGVLMGKEVETLKQLHPVHVLTFCNNQREKELLRDHPDFGFIRTSPLIFLRKVLTFFWMPNMFALRKDRQYWKKACEIIEREQIDAVYAEYTAMGQYSRLKKKYPGLVFHLVEHDIAIQSYERQCTEAKGIRKIYKQIERAKVWKYEKQYVRNADLVYVLNGKDEKLLAERYGVKNIRVLNPYYGIDFSRTGETGGKEKAICFIGNMGRDENHTAAMRLIRIFREMNLTDWKLNIIGAYPREELKQQESDSIHITGFVEDINAEIVKNAMAVFPLTCGAGIKLKVLLAFSLGLPVITSAVGAEGIDPEGKVLLLAETDEKFRSGMETLMENEDLRTRIGAASLAYVRKNFGWDKSEQIFREVYGTGENPASVRRETGSR